MHIIVHFTLDEANLLFFAMPRRKLAVMSVVIVSPVQFVNIGSSVFSSRRAFGTWIDFMLVGASFHLDALEPSLFLVLIPQVCVDLEE